eukprot:6766475-Karenia_brevis.AAC.1
MSADDNGAGYAKKRTSVATNSEAIARELEKFQCDGSHPHVQLTHGRAGPCQIYPDKFCKHVCLTAAKERASTVSYTHLTLPTICSV